MNPASNDIYMKTGDMARFKISLMKNQSCAELWNLWRITVSPDFFCVIQIKIRCFISWTSTENSKHPGLGINILPLQCEYGPKGENISGTVCAKRDGRGSTEKKAKVAEPA